LYRGKYLTNSNYKYRYVPLNSLTAFYDYLCFDKYRYTITVVTLKYDNQSDHNSNNLSALLKHLQKYHVDKQGNRIPLHTVWKLEHRKQTALSKSNKAGGWHYHIALITNRDISSSNKSLINRVRKQWEKWGCIHVTAKVHQTPQPVDSYQGSFSEIKLDTPTYNTDTTSIASVFHHLSYLAKDDPKQKLPDSYKGKSFNVSKLDITKLTGHEKIKEHANCSRPKQDKIEDWMLDDYTIEIPLNEELQKQFDNIEFPF